MLSKHLEVVVNNCPDLETAESLMKVAKSLNIQVKFKQEVIYALEKSSGKAFESAQLPVYTPVLDVEPPSRHPKP